MNSFIILRSSTAAMHAVKILRKENIPASYTKKVTSRGCRFGVTVNGDPEEICRVLRKKGVYCVEIKGGGMLK